MDKPMPVIYFKLMSLSFKLRDILLPRAKILREVPVKPGFTILDYGCGPGSYTIPAAQLAGKTGKVYALDIHPFAIQMVQKIASKRRLTNIETILSDRETGLPDDSVDVALLYDVFHGLSAPEQVLKELHRVLKPDGILSVNDHHLKEREIISRITNKGLFRLSEKGKRVSNFSKSNA